MTKKIVFRFIEADTAKMLEMQVQSVVEHYCWNRDFAMKVDTQVIPWTVYEYWLPITIFKYTASLHITYNTIP